MVFLIGTETEIENKSKSFIALLGKLEQIRRHCDNVIMYMLCLREKNAEMHLHIYEWSLVRLVILQSGHFCSASFISGV